MKKRYSSIIEERSPFPNERKPSTSSSTSVNANINNSNKSNSTNKEKEVDQSMRENNTRTKVNIEDEFDKFFSKYKKPGDSYTLSYSRTSPIGNRVSPSTSRLTTSIRRSNSEDQDKPKTDEKLANKPPRKSRFLRPDFYDTPREESKYVIQNDKVRAFRERSLSRQRDLSRNRSTNPLSNGWNTDYLRSKTCSIADKMDSLQRRDFKRTISEDRTANNIDNNNAKLELTSPNSRNDSELENFKTAKRKSLILQNELENEIRKTQNINSKLSGLMVALNDTENQYEKKLGRLYGLKKDKSPNEEGHSNCVNKSEVDYEMKPITGCDESEPASSNKAKNNLESKSESKYEPKSDKREPSNNYENLSLLDKKYAYFRRLRNKEQTENGVTESTSEPNADCTLKKSTSAASSCSPEKDAYPSATAAEEVDSDACSMLSDGTDSQYFDNMNDRIRRRSFYSRFNNYNPAPRARPLAYSRSVSADVSRPHRSTSSTRTNRTTTEYDSQPNNVLPK